MVNKVKKFCHLSPTLFGIYIDKLEDCLEKVGCVVPTLIGIVINLLLYANDIVFMERSPHDIGNQIRILKDFCSNMSMNVNIDKTKVMIIKSNIRFFMIPSYMTKTTWRKWIHTNILELIFTTRLIGIIAFRKRLLGDGNLIMGLKTIVN